MSPPRCVVNRNDLQQTAGFGWCGPGRRYMMAGMRLSAVPALVVVGALSTVAGGCAHTLREDRVVVAVDSAPATGAEVVEVTEPPPVIMAEPAASRPRLSRTVTLGEGTVEPVFAAAPQQAATAGGPSVVVNNNITVVGGPTVYGGYGYGYGGGYGGYVRTGRTTGSRDTTNRTGSTGSTQPWAASGWEGAGRTAAPGQTPHVGGNWAPPASHGPRQLK